MGRIRVIHAPEAVGGQSPELSAAERRVGLDSEAISLRPHPFGYEGIRVFGKTPLRPLGVFAAWCRMFFHVLRHSDVLHLNFGRSIFDPGPNVLSRIPRWSGIRLVFFLLQRLEFLSYRVRGIAVFVTYQGSDARQGDRQGDRTVSIVSHGAVDFYTGESDALKRKRIRMFSRHACRIFFLNPDLAELMEPGAEFIPYSSVNLHQWEPIPPGDGVLRHVVHAPSKRGTKGSHFVLEAVERLRSEGIDFHFTLVENKSRTEARRIYENADILVDQVLAGWYGGLAVEGMALGKPVIAYLREEDLGVVPAEMRNDLPIIRATPDTICGVLRDWLQKPAEEYRARSFAARDFVEKWHDPDKIALRMKEEYEKSLQRIG